MQSLHVLAVRLHCRVSLYGLESLRMYSLLYY